MHIPDTHWSLRHKENSPVYQKLQAQRSFNMKSKKDFFGKSPTIFVGRFGYPKVNVGFLSVEQYQHHDEPLRWAHEDYSIQKIIGLRTVLVNSRFQTDVKQLKGRFLDLTQDVAMADRPTDMEINLTRRPQFRLSWNQEEIGRAHV